MSHSQLYKEAAIVGVALVPMWLAVAHFTTATSVLTNTPQLKTMLDVAIAGALFHLAAEESGLNHYYLTHSYAYEKSFKEHFRADEYCRVESNHWSDHSVCSVFNF